MVYGRSKKEVRKRILEKIAGSKYKLTCCKSITLPEYSWYDYDTDIYPSEDEKLEQLSPATAQSDH